jgi:hypothetical protein
VVRSRFPNRYSVHGRHRISLTKMPRNISSEPFGGAHP